MQIQHECGRHVHHTPHLPATNVTPPPKAAHQNSSSLLPPSRRSLLPAIPAHNNPSSCIPMQQQWRPHAMGNSSLLNFWASAPGTAATAASITAPSPTFYLQSQSSRRFSGAPLSPPRAHSNHSPSPPRQGDPRHLEGGLLELTRPPEWFTTNQ